MTFFSSSRGRTLALAVTCLLAACNDEDTCGAASLQLEVTPSTACLDLTATAGTSAGSYLIVGTNNCADPLIVQSPETHDGGASATFPAGAAVSIQLYDGEVFNQDAAVKTWQRTAGLGAETIIIKMTKAPC